MNKATLKVSDGSQMDVYHSSAVKGAPGVIVLMEAFGVNSHVKSLVERFAKLGYLAVAPELYHRTGPGFTCGYGEFMSAAAPHFNAMSTQGMIADVQACFDWLREEQACEKVASVGYCLGGRVSFVANSEVPLSAAVSYYGGRIVPDLLPLAEKQKAPILFFWGGQDSNIPPEHYQALSKALRSSKKDHVEVVISDAQHGFCCDERPSYNPRAEKQAWAHTAEFLKSYLQ